MAYKLVRDHTYSYGYQYRGTAEQCIFTFSLGPEQIPGTDWIRDRIVNSFASKVRDNRGEMLRLLVYEDKAPTWHTDYIIVATAANLSAQSLGVEPQLAQLAWTLIIGGVLAIIFMITLNYTIKSITQLFYGGGEGGVSFGDIMYMGMMIGMMVVMMLMVSMVEDVGEEKTKRVEEGEKEGLWRRISRKLV